MLVEMLQRGERLFLRFFPFILCLSLGFRRSHRQEAGGVAQPVQGAEGRRVAGGEDALQVEFDKAPGVGVVVIAQQAQAQPVGQQAPDGILRQIKVALQQVVGGQALHPAAGLRAGVQAGLPVLPARWQHGVNGNKSS